MSDSSTVQARGVGPSLKPLSNFAEEQILGPSNDWNDDVMFFLNDMDTQVANHI